MYEPPKGLKRAGLALWRQTIDGVQDGWRLDAGDLTVLEECCRLRDTEARLQRRVDREGATVRGSEGQLVAHPLLRELRMTRALVLTNIKRVEIARPRATTRISTSAVVTSCVTPARGGGSDGPRGCA